MADNFNPVDGNPMYWAVNPTSSDEFQTKATSANLRPWSHHEQEQTFHPQGASHLTDMFDGRTLPASQEDNLDVAGTTFYNKNDRPYIPMSEGYALGETPDVRGALLPVHTGQGSTYDYSEVSRTTEPASAANGTGSENPNVQNYRSTESPAESFIAPGLSPSLDDGGHYIRRSSSSRSQDQLRDLVICGNCGEKFRGKYANGNFTRHQKTQKCASSIRRKEWPCGACYKVYQRSDALLKHTRKHHTATTPGSV